MSANSKIEWTEHTFNPWWGCEKVSPGCTHCYAESFSKRVGFAIWGHGTERRYFGVKHWSEPVKWDNTARTLGVMHRVFCGSMCDVLEDRDGLTDPRMTAFDLADATPNLLWLFLTKRPENAVAMLPTRWRKSWPRNVALGVTIEDQPRLELRMPNVMNIHQAFPGVSMFASCEPLLSSLEWRIPGLNWANDTMEYFDWVIGGGESGNGCRQMEISWIRKLRNDCEERTDMGRPWPVPFLFKQWGGRLPGGPRELDGRTWDGIPILSYGPQLPGVKCFGADEVSA